MDQFLRDLEQDLDDLAASLVTGEVADEFRADRLTFLEHRADDEAAGRRHLEWFLLERESSAIGSIPLELAVDMRTTREDDKALRYAALRSSRAGIFVVARVDPEEGLLLDELLGRGQYVIDERELAAELEPGDLLVGRIFPRDLAGAGELTTWCLSSAAANLRNPELLAALQRDVEAMRQRARGPLRMTQAELELMFFRESLVAPGQTEADTPSQELPEPSVSEVLAETRGKLLEGGLDEVRWSELLEVLRASPMPAQDLALGGDDPLGWILEELAFETEVDLARSRELLANLWKALHRGSASAQRTEPDEAAAADVAAALARFDEGRQAGLDSDSLFASLEAELGLAPDEEDDDHRVPDFPGVLGALVQEFLWDGARLADQDLDAFVAGHRELELLVGFGSFLGVAEELDLDHLKVFLGRWIWEQPEVLAGVRDLQRLGTSLESFLTWLGEHHGHGVGEGLELLLATFGGNAERILSANQELAERLEKSKAPAATGSPVTLRRTQDGSWENVSGLAPLREPSEAPEGLSGGDWLVCLEQADALVGRLVLPPIDGPHLKATS